MIDTLFVAQKGEIILLEDGTTQIVVDQIRYENESYLLIKAVTDDIVDFFESKPASVSFVREVINGEEYSLEQVTEKTMVEALFAEAKKKLKK